MKAADFRESVIYGIAAGLIANFAPASFLADGVICALGFRKGWSSVLVSSGVFFIISLLFILTRSNRLADTLLTVSGFLVFLPGILFIVKNDKNFSVSVRLAFYSIIWFILIGGGYAFLILNKPVMDSLVGYFARILEQIMSLEVFAQSRERILDGRTSTDLIRLAITQIVNLSAALIYCTLGFIYWTGQLLQGILDGGPRRFSVRRFSIHQNLVWLLIACLGFLGLVKFVDLQLWMFPFWNVVIVLSFLYGLQGLGIILTLLDRINTPILLRGIALILITVIYGLNNTNPYVLLSLPVLGLSENWIKYRKWKRSESNENYSK